VRAANCHDDLLDACKRLQRLASLLTVRQVIEAGEEAIEAAGHNPWFMNEGLATGDERVSMCFAEVAIQKAEEGKP
jgi:hypothetical protein